MSKITLSTISGKNAYSKRMRDLAKTLSASNTLKLGREIPSPADSEMMKKLTELLVPHVKKAFEFPIPTESEQELKKAIIGAFIVSDEYTKMDCNLSIKQLTLLVDEMITFYKSAKIAGNNEKPAEVVADVNENRILAFVKWGAQTHLQQTVSTGVNIATAAVCASIATTMPMLAGAIAVTKFIATPLISAAVKKELAPHIEKGINVLTNRAKSVLSSLDILPSIN